MTASPTHKQRSLEHCAAAGITAHGQLGDAHPLQAIDDAMRVFRPDEIIIATHPPGRSNWLERDVVADARRRYHVPIVHVDVDSAHNDAHVVNPDARARAAEAHPTIPAPRRSPV